LWNVLGVLAPNAKWREEVVWYGHGGSARHEGRQVASAPGPGGISDDGQAERDHPRGARRSYTWAELMRRAFLVDVLDCPRCHGRMRVIATIDEPAVVKKILEHLGLTTEIPSPKAARSPPDDQELPPDNDDF
jgi:hypothetical protein